MRGIGIGLLAAASLLVPTIAGAQTAQQGFQGAPNWSGGQIGASNGLSFANNGFVEPGAYLCSAVGTLGVNCFETPFSFSSQPLSYTIGPFLATVGDWETMSPVPKPIGRGSTEQHPQVCSSRWHLTARRLDAQTTWRVRSRRIGTARLGRVSGSSPPPRPWYMPRAAWLSVRSTAPLPIVGSIFLYLQVSQPPIQAGPTYGPAQPSAPGWKPSCGGDGSFASNTATRTMAAKPRLFL